jgi:sugar phosphate isomerase/epimerase
METAHTTDDRRPHVGGRLLSLAAGTHIDIAPPETVDAAAAAGFPAVGVWFDADTWTDDVARAVRSRLEHHGLVALDIEPIMLSPDGDHGEAIVDAAFAVGARNILVASREPDDGRVAARLAELAARVEGSDIRLVLEFLPALATRTLAQAVAIVERVAHPNVGVLIDALHLARAGETPADVAAVPGHLFPYLQLCDAPASIDDTSPRGLIHEALHARLLPGEGALPLDALLAAVPDVPISFELRSAHLRDSIPDPVERARVVLASVRP